MITTITGILVEKNPTSVVVENAGIGFSLSIPLSSYRSLGNVGSEVRLLTYLHVREDALQLYGFATTEERELFRMLISVSGVGPKLAQTILSGLSVREFYEAIQHQAVDRLTSAQGVGKKTAERLVVELKDKVGEGKVRLFSDPLSQQSTIIEEAVLALESLGFRKTEAAGKVKTILQSRKDLSVEEVVRLSLQKK